MLTSSTLRVYTVCQREDIIEDGPSTPNPIETERDLTVGNLKQLSCLFPVCPLLSPLTSKEPN